MRAGSEREALLRIADRLCAELDLEGERPQVSDADLSGDESDRAGWDILSADDQSFIAAIRNRLAILAAKVARSPLEAGAQRAVVSALDGAELVMRGELVRGSAGHLFPLMPSFVFLVTLPIADRDRALDLSRRTSELIAETDN